MTFTNWFVLILVCYFIPTRCFLTGLIIGNSADKEESNREVFTSVLAVVLFPELALIMVTIQWICERIITFIDVVDNMIAWILGKIAGN